MTQEETVKRGPGRPPIDPELRQITIAVSMPLELITALQERAVELGTSRSELMRRAALIILGRADNE